MPSKNTHEIRSIPFSPPLDRRSQMPEMMDIPCSDITMLENTLAHFRSINRYLARTRYILTQHVLSRMHPKRLYHLVDLGAGACETAVWLLNRCRSLRLRLRITACDHDPRVIGFAAAKYGHTPGLDILRRDITDIGDLKRADFVFGSHLLHHLDDERIAGLLEYLADFEHATVLFSDLRRCRGSYAAYYLMSPFLFRNSFARYDGLLSIRKGFTEAELLGFIRSADPNRFYEYRISRMFPSRILLIRHCKKKNSCYAG